MKRIDNSTKVNVQEAIEKIESMSKEQFLDECMELIQDLKHCFERMQDLLADKKEIAVAAQFGIVCGVASAGTVDFVGMAGAPSAINSAALEVAKDALNTFTSDTSTRDESQKD